LRPQNPAVAIALARFARRQCHHGRVRWPKVSRAAEAPAVLHARLACVCVTHRGADQTRGARGRVRERAFRSACIQKSASVAAGHRLRRLRLRIRIQIGVAASAAAAAAAKSVSPPLPLPPSRCHRRCRCRQVGVTAAAATGDSLAAVYRPTRSPPTDRPTDRLGRLALPEFFFSNRSSAAVGALNFSHRNPPRLVESAEKYLVACHTKSRSVGRSVSRSGSAVSRSAHCRSRKKKKKANGHDDDDAKDKDGGGNATTRGSQEGRARRRPRSRLPHIVSPTLGSRARPNSWHLRDTRGARARRRRQRR
jgi:hypothetical protein